MGNGSIDPLQHGILGQCHTEVWAYILQDIGLLKIGTFQWNFPDYPVYTDTISTFENRTVLSTLTSTLILSVPRKILRFSHMLKIFTFLRIFTIFFARETHPGNL